MIMSNKSHDIEFTATQYKVLRGLVYTTAKGGNEEIWEITGRPKHKRPRIRKVGASVPSSAASAAPASQVFEKLPKNATAEERWAAICRTTAKLCK